MTDLTRRGAMLAATMTAAAAVATAAAAQDTAAAPAIKYDPKPLPFDPKSVHGLSEKLLTNHHDKNYAGAVTRLGQIQTRLAGLDLAKEPGFVLNGLKREELIALNSMILHETYFAGFNDKKTPGDKLAGRIAKDWGSFDRWRTEFAAMGRALGGGSGWVLLTWSPRAGRLVNLWASDHTQTGADGSVLLALDMYEHAYQVDYGPDAGAYVEAFLGAMGWAHADEAFAAA